MSLTPCPLCGGSGLTEGVKPGLLPTPKQLAILKFIQAHMASAGVCPSLKEIMQAIGIRSVSTVHKHLRLMQNKCLIRIAPNGKRAIEIL